MKKILLLCLFCVASSVFAQTAPQQTLMIKLKITGNHYDLLDSWLLSRVFPATLDAPSERALRWQLMDADHQVITQGWLSDPQILRGALLEDRKLGDKVFRHEGDRKQDSADIILRVPYDPRIAILQIERQSEIPVTVQKAPPAAKAALAAPAAKTEFVITPRPAQ